MNTSKYLIATKEKQGARSNDFSYADEGHVVIFGSVCGGAKVDDKCGCKRSMITPSNAKATTTVKVVECSENDLRNALKETLDHYVNGWGIDEEEAVKMASTELTQNKRLANSFDLNTVLEIRGNKIQVRA